VPVTASHSSRDSRINSGSVPAARTSATAAPPAATTVARPIQAAGSPVNRVFPSRTRDRRIMRSNIGGRFDGGSPRPA
jgi:hypothetical protein